MKQPTERFSVRVDHYVKYRPGYPSEIIDLLTSNCGLHAQSLVADIGSGTGLLSRLFLDNGNKVYGVEPNAGMRDAAQRLLSHYPSFTSVSGTAEDTTLPGDSADFITAGQAFHWFKRLPAKREFSRLLRSHGRVVLVWNQRRVDSSIFLREYERILKTYSKDYSVVDHRNVGRDAITEFFSPRRFELARYDNHQDFDFEGLNGRLLSSSYAPSEDQPEYAPMIEELTRAFEQYQSNGTVRFEYDTMVYYGQFS
jgi:SAM-dependent methyltransferase